MNELIPSLAIIGAKYLFGASLFIAGIYFLKVPRRAQKNILIFSLVTIPFILLIALLGNHLYENPRPFVVGGFTPLIPHAPDNGFPSDHALLVSAIASVFILFSRRIGIILWIIAMFVAVSRVYVGVHHPIDVIGSMIISVFVTIIAYLIIKKRYPSFFGVN